MSNKKETSFQKIYHLVNEPTKDYFRAVWMEEMGLSREQFYKRLKKPQIDDVLLFCHVCKVDEKVILQPMKEKFKNIPPYNTTIQLTIE